MTCEKKMAISINASCNVATIDDLTLTSPMPGVWRLQTAVDDDKKGVIQTLAAWTGEKLEGAYAALQLSHEGGVIATDSDVKVKLTPDGMAFFDNDERNNLSLFRLIKKDNQISLEFGLQTDEALFGTGERFNGVNQRGEKVTIWAEDRWCQTEGNSYLPIPFILSSRNYAVLINRFEAAQFDLGNQCRNLWSLTQLDAPLDVYLIFGNQPVDIYAKLVKLWGHPVVPPDWSWGTLVSRHLFTGEFSTPEGIREMAAQMTKHDLPWDAVIIEGWDTFDPETYDALKKIAAELTDDNKKVLVYEACGRLPEKYWSAHQARSEYFIRNQEGSCEVQESPHFNPQDAPDRRQSCFLDVTNPEAVKWWQEKIWRPLLDDIGISGAKIDFCEQIPEDYDLILHSGASFKGLHHRYPVQYNLMMSQLFNKFAADGGLCWSRGGSTGAHLYPFVWCGDQLREFDSLKAILSAILSSGISGVPFMGHDLGGYIPANNGDNDAEVFIRGVEFSCFTAAMSTHGKVTRPYDFPVPYVDIYRYYSKIRYLLRPYLIEQAEICSQTGLPLVRHLFLHYPDDCDCLNCDDQYLFGEDILVAPVLHDSRSRSVILPPGKWYGLFDARTYQGKSELKNYPVPLNNIPVFIAATPKSKVLKKIVAGIRQLAMPENSCL